MSDKPITEKEECLSIVKNRFGPPWNPIYWGQVAGLVALIISMKDILGNSNPKMVELGSAGGESGSMFSGSGVFSKVFHVDMWGDDAVEEVCRYNLDRYPCSEIVKGDMFEIAEGWTEQVDAIYLDAEHTYEEVKKGLEQWDKHLRPGGIWSGHDFNPEVWPGVVLAVREFFPDSKITVFEDKSWMVVKN